MFFDTSNFLKSKCAQFKFVMEYPSVYPVTMITLIGVICILDMVSRNPNQLWGKRAKVLDLPLLDRG